MYIKYFGTALYNTKKSIDYHATYNNTIAYFLIERGGDSAPLSLSLRKEEYVIIIFKLFMVKNERHFIFVGDQTTMRRNNISVLSFFDISPTSTGGT